MGRVRRVRNALNCKRDQTEFKAILQKSSSKIPSKTMNNARYSRMNSKSSEETFQSTGPFLSSQSPRDSIAPRSSIL